MNRIVFLFLCSSLFLFNLIAYADNDSLWKVVDENTDQLHSGQLSIKDYETNLLGLADQTDDPELLGKIYYELAMSFHKPLDGFGLLNQYETYGRKALPYPFTFRDPSNTKHLERKMRLYIQLSAHISGKNRECFYTDDWPKVRKDIAIVMLKGIQESLDLGYPVDPSVLANTGTAICYGDSGLITKLSDPELEAERLRTIAAYDEHNRKVNYKSELRQAGQGREMLEYMVRELFLRTYHRDAPFEPDLSWPEEDKMEVFEEVVNEVITNPEMRNRLIGDFLPEVLKFENNQALNSQEK